MPFQFGTNWSRYAYATANIISPLLAYEGLMAFFLEAAFLGVLLFGRKLVPRWAHFFAAVMVAVGTLFSSFWILAVNSWMQTPAGAKLVDGRFIPESWLQIVFSPSFPTRLGHTVIGFAITTGFVVLSVAAGYLLHERFVPEARRMMSTTLWLLLGLIPLQIFLGDASGLVTLHYQPAKLAAIEARWDTGSRVPLTLFAIPDQKDAVNHDAIEIPALGSLILTHDINGTVQGIEGFSARRLASGDHSILHLPHHGRHRPADAGDRRYRQCHAPLRQSVHQPPVPACLPVRSASRLHRRAGRLGHHRGRPPALDGVWPAAHSRFRHPVAHRLERGGVVDRLHGGLRDHLPRGRPGDGAHRPRRPVGSGRRRRRRERAAAIPVRAVPDARVGGGAA